MTSKIVIPRELARSDVEAAVDYLLLEAGGEVALGFVDALEETYDLIARYPKSGSLRYGYELGLPELRGISLKRYPYIVFCREQKDSVDVWRILHGKRDIPLSMQESENR